MPEQTARLRLDGHFDLTAIDRVFVSHMVGVASIDEATADAIFIVPDEDGCINLTDPKDFEWLADVIATTLNDSGQFGIRITLERQTD